VGFLKNISNPGSSDEHLIERFKQSNDLTLLSELFQRYMDLVYGVCLKYLKQPEDAQDSVMSIFEELTVKLTKHEIGNFKNWLYTLAKNHCLMRLRSEKKQFSVHQEPELMQLEENEHLNSVLEKEENLNKLELCLEQLQDDQRRAIELFYLEGKCYNEIATITGIEWNKVRSHIQNGRRNLKLCMENQKVKSTV
jgi:RNA polymerase sigma-70 factor (ECF subfamily)